jgi:hypothetical protein
LRLILEECRQLVDAVFAQLFLGNVLLHQNYDVIRKHLRLRLAQRLQLLHEVLPHRVLLSWCQPHAAPLSPVQASCLAPLKLLLPPALTRHELNVDVVTLA